MLSKIPALSGALNREIRTIVEAFISTFPDVDIHSIKIDGKFNYVTKELEYGIYADVREKGQIFLGMSS